MKLPSVLRPAEVSALRKRLETLKATPPEVASKASPLKGGRQVFADGKEALPADPTLAWLQTTRVAERLIGPFDFSYANKKLKLICGDADSIECDFASARDEAVRVECRIVDIYHLFSYLDGEAHGKGDLVDAWHKPVVPRHKAKQVNPKL